MQIYGKWTFLARFHPVHQNSVSNMLEKLVSGECSPILVKKRAPSMGSEWDLLLREEILVKGAEQTLENVQVRLYPHF